MTKNEMQWLSHFLRRVVTHNPTEVEMLWQLVSKIETQLRAQNQCASIRATAATNEPANQR